MDNLKTNVVAVWNGGTMGNGTLKGDHIDTKIAISKSSGGSGDGAEPKELLVSSALTCYIETLAYMLDSRKVPVDAVSINSEATVFDKGFNIMHYPQIILTADATEEDVLAAQKIIEGADRGCKVGNLLRKAGIKIVVQGNVSTK